VKLGVVASLNRPGGNLTGISQFTAALEPKRLELLREVIPNAPAIAMIVNPDRPDSESQVREVQAAANTLGQQIIVLTANSESSIDAAFATLIQQHASALLVASDAISPVGANSSLRWRRVTRCQQSTNGAISPPSAV
jgi:putative ABC transport system substrate-binding protein